MALELLSRSSLKDRQILSSSVIATNFGYLGALITLLAIAAFDITILNIGLKSDNIRDKTFIHGDIWMSHLPANMEYWNDSWITSYYWYYFTNAVLWRIIITFIHVRNGYYY